MDENRSSIPHLEKRTRLLRYLLLAGVLEGRIVTGWKSIVQDSINAGVNFEDKEVVVDNNLVSSRSPKKISIFTESCLAKLIS